MAKNGDCTSNSPNEETLDEKINLMMYKVAQKRKRYPKTCGQYISKKLKMEHFMLEKTKIDLAENRLEIDENDNEVEIPVKDVDTSSLNVKMNTLQGDIDNILQVLSQIKSEESCMINKACRSIVS